jgi:hypothetical protein
MMTEWLMGEMVTEWIVTDVNYHVSEKSGGFVTASRASSICHTGSDNIPHSKLLQTTFKLSPNFSNKTKTVSTVYISPAY